MNNPKNDARALTQKFNEELAALGGQLDALYAKHDNHLKLLVESGAGPKDPDFCDTVEMLEAIKYSIVMAFMADHDWGFDLEDPCHRWVKCIPMPDPQPPRHGNPIVS